MKKHCCKKNGFSAKLTQNFESKYPNFQKKARGLGRVPCILAWESLVKVISGQQQTLSHFFCFFSKKRLFLIKKGATSTVLRQLLCQPIIIELWAKMKKHCCKKMDFQQNSLKISNPSTLTFKKKRADWEGGLVFQLGKVLSK